MNIIVIDDEPAPLLAFSSNIFDNSQISANMFSLQIDDALDFAKNNVCKAVFLDINMPTINGVDLAEKFIKISPNIKVIFITGYAQDIADIKQRIGDNFFDFCYKPYDPITLQTILSNLINEKTIVVHLKTFPHFDCFIGNILVDFNRSKSKELLALLVDRRGSTVTLGDAISHLWSDKEMPLAKKLYRDAICRLRLTLKKYHILHIVKIGRARLSLNIQYCTCDMWDFIDGKNYSEFLGEYMHPYEWSVDREYFLNNLATSSVT